MDISIMEAVGKIVEINGDEAQALAITVVKEGTSYTGLIGISPLRMDHNAIMLAAAMQSALDREFPIARAIIKGVEAAGGKIMTPDGTREIKYTSKKQPERKAPENREAESAVEKLLEQIFGNMGGCNDADVN